MILNKYTLLPDSLPPYLEELSTSNCYYNQISLPETLLMLIVDFDSNILTKLIINGFPRDSIFPYNNIFDKILPNILW